MNKKLIFGFCIFLLILTPIASAGIISDTVDFFKELFGIQIVKLTDTNYINDRGLELKTNEETYNCLNGNCIVYFKVKDIDKNKGKLDVIAMTSQSGNLYKAQRKLIKNSTKMIYNNQTGKTDEVTLPIIEWVDVNLTNEDGPDKMQRRIKKENITDSLEYKLFFKIGNDTKLSLLTETSDELVGLDPYLNYVDFLEGTEYFDTLDPNLWFNYTANVSDNCAPHQLTTGGYFVAYDSVTVACGGSWGALGSYYDFKIPDGNFSVNFTYRCTVDSGGADNAGCYIQLISDPTIKVNYGGGQHYYTERAIEKIFLKTEGGSRDTGWLNLTLVIINQTGNLANASLRYANNMSKILDFNISTNANMNSGGWYLYFEAGGEASGNPVTYNMKIMEVSIVGHAGFDFNGRPMITNQSITPNPAYLSDGINYTIQSYDPDGNNTLANISFYKNGIMQFSKVRGKSGGNGPISLYISPGNFSKYDVGSNISFTAQLTDILLWSDNVSSSIILSSLFNTNSENYSISTIEGYNETFSVNVSSMNGTVSNVFFNYNNTDYPATFTQENASTWVSSIIIPIPIYNADLQIPFYWSFNSTYEIYNTSKHNQTTYKLTTFEFTGLNCSTGLSPSMFFNFNNENNLSFLNASVDYNFKYGVTNNTLYSTYGNIANSNHFYLCINSTVWNNYSVGYGEIQYQEYTYNYVKRRYYVFNGQRVSNVTSSNTLYDLLNIDATSFLFTITDQSLIPYENKYVSLMRWYPNLDSYKIVDMGLTDDKGQTVIRVKSEDTDYRVGIYELDGTLIYLAKPTRFECLSSPCSYSIIVNVDNVDYTDFFNVQTSLDYDSSLKLFTFTWNDPSQNTQEMNLVVVKEVGDHTVQICNTIGSGWTGALNCNVSDYTGNIRAVAYRTASPQKAIATDDEFISTSTLFKSSVGLFLIFLLFVFLTFLGAYSPVASIITGGLALIPAIALQIISLGVAVSIGVLAGIIIHFIKRS